MGFTSRIANIIPLRGLLMRPNILSRIPPELKEFRDCILETIPCFKYGEALDSMYINTTAVGRDANEESECICGQPHWSKYTVKVKDGSKCVVTTDADCLRNKHAAAILRLQAGFRQHYMITMQDIPFVAQVEKAIQIYVHELCSELGIQFNAVKDWFETLLEEIKSCLKDINEEEEEGLRPLTGGIDFIEAREAFKKSPQNGCNY